MGFGAFADLMGMGGDKPFFPQDSEGNNLNLYVSEPGKVGYYSPSNYNPNDKEGSFRASQFDFTGLSGEGGRENTVFTDANGLKYKYNYVNDSFEGLDPQTAKYYLENNPDAYYSTLANQLKNDYFDSWKVGHADGSLNNQLEAIKDVSPKSYYEAKLNLLGQEAGWYQGQNTTGGIAPLMKQAEELAPEAYKYGVAPQQMTSLVNQGFSAANRENATRIANEKSSGGSMFSTLPQFAATTAAMFAAPALAGYLTPLVGGSALAGGAATGALLGGATGALNSAIGEKNIGEGLLKGATIGGVLGGVGGGISDAFGAFNAPSEADLAAYANTTQDPIGTMAQLKDMTPAELANAFGPGAGETSSNFLEKATSKVGTTLAKSELAKLLTSPSSGATATPSAASSAASPTTTGSTTASQLASLLAPAAQTNNFIGQYKMNQNPFTFTSQGQTAASPGMYDVSGSNLANALRKA
jgi:hypothetical protein